MKFYKDGEKKLIFCITVSTSNNLSWIFSSNKYKVSCMDTRLYIQYIYIYIFLQTLRMLYRNRFTRQYTAVILYTGTGGGLSWERSIYLSLHRSQTELDQPITLWQQACVTHREKNYNTQAQTTNNKHTHT